MSIESPVTPSIVPGDTAPERIDAGEPISPSPYSARLLGWSDEELASSDFFRLVDAIRWLSDAEHNGAIAKRAGIYSATGELVWAKTFASDHDQRERVMKYNALRILVQVD
jgi:hypothetical protein